MHLVGALQPSVEHRHKSQQVLALDHQRVALDGHRVDDVVCVTTPYYYLSLTSEFVSPMMRVSVSEYHSKSLRSNWITLRSHSLLRQTVQEASDAHRRVVHLVDQLLVVRVHGHPLLGGYIQSFTGAGAAAAAVVAEHGERVLKLLASLFSAVAGLRQPAVLAQLAADHGSDVEWVARIPKIVVAQLVILTIPSATDP